MRNNPLPAEVITSLMVGEAPCCRLHGPDSFCTEGCPFHGWETDRIPALLEQSRLADQRSLAAHEELRK